jgi:hypothetical protein
MVFARRSRAALVLTLLVSGVVLSSSAALAGAPDRRQPLPKGATDITDSAKGQKLVREAKERYAQRGHKAGELRAVEDATGILIAPIDTKFTTYSATLEDGSKVTAVAPLTADDPAGTEDEAAGANAALLTPTWKFISNNCFTKSDGPWAVVDHCYYKYKLANDGNGSYDWYALHRYGTAYNNSPWVLDRPRFGPIGAAVRRSRGPIGTREQIGTAAIAPRRASASRPRLVGFRSPSSAAPSR